MGPREDHCAIRRWTRRYGEPPGADDWSAAMARGRPEKLARLRERDWPCAPTVQHYFGSWNAAIEAAGLTPRPRWRPPRTGGATRRS